MNKITIYSKKFCPACTQTQELLASNGLVYGLVDITNDSTAIRAFAELGYQQFPIILVDDGQQVWGWSGFQPDKINKLL